MKNHVALGTLVAVLSSFFLLDSLSASPQATDQVEAGQITNEDYGIYNALLSEVRFPKEADVLILDDTLDFKCGADSELPILLNGCSPMILPPNTPKEIKQLLRQGWPKMEKQTWDDFERVNSKSGKLRDAFATNCKHELAGDDIHHNDSKNSDSPSGAFYFSRVGFNVQKTQAIVFVFFASYIDHVPSTGDYFLLGQNKKRQWKLMGRVNELETDSKGN
ncbi:MAG TPA: hypothetical protein VGR94_02385 [Candidatus Acidoferrales bacterium]|nr:hypothetical protein [Candidatus Acidoferrales bacterium]